MNEQEYLNKLRDHKFYLENLCQIKTKEKGYQPFILKKAQIDLFNTMRRHNRIMLLKARQLGMCLHGDTRILSHDLKWIKLSDIKIGQKIISVEEYSEKGKGKGRRMKIAIIEKKMFVYEDAFKIKLDNGVEIIATSEHRFLSKKWEKVTDLCWKKVKEMEIGTSIRYITKPWNEAKYEDGWISGMIDGEGSLAKKSRKGASVGISQVPGKVWDRLNKYFNLKNYNYRIEWDTRKPLENSSSKLGNKPVGKVVISRMNELFKLIGQTRPSRFKNNDWWEGKNLPGKKSGDAWTKILSIENIGKKEMIDLQTSEKTFIAEGLVSHNSTAVAGFIYVDTIMRPGITSALVGYNSDMVVELLDKIRTFHATTPKELQPKVHFDSKNEMSFPAMGSKIMVLPNTKNVGRSLTLQNVLITELSSWDDAEEKMNGLVEAVPEGGRIIIESTPRGMGNLYHRMWMINNSYIKKEYGWWWEYTKEQMAIKEKEKGEMMFAQEYGMAFLSSGRNVFDVNVINKHRKNILKVGDINKAISEGQQDFTVKEEDGWTIYREPEPDGIYLVGGDVAEGVVGGDYSVATIFDRKTGEEVAMYRGHIPPDRFGDLLDKWGRKYNNALMVVEINNHGLTTITILKQKIYPSLYFRPSKFETLSIGVTDRIGWRTTAITRPLLIDELAKAMREEDITIHSKKTLDEMSVFIYNDNGDMVPSQGHHDDTIFSTGIALQGFKSVMTITPTQLNYEKILPRNFSY